MYSQHLEQKPRQKIQIPTEVRAQRYLRPMGVLSHQNGICWGSVQVIRGLYARPVYNRRKQGLPADLCHTSRGTGLATMSRCAGLGLGEVVFFHRRY